jgi:hypothetical protein
VLVKEARSNVADDDMAQLANGQRSGSVISVNFLKVPVAEADVRFGAQSGLKSDIARGPKSPEGDIASYSITSSALVSKVGGTFRPSALAVRRLITNSNLVGA